VPGGFMNFYKDLAINVISFCLVVLATVLSSTDLAGFLWGGPIILAVVSLNIYYKAEVLAIDALKIGLAVSIVYNIAVYIVNDTVLNLHMSQPSELFKLLFFSCFPYFFIFMPIFAFFTKK
tara:strand:+ start:395 stop:757 length:363 start_codon:yes stop_codon:yes gene_type:complete